MLTWRIKAGFRKSFLHTFDSIEFADTLKVLRSFDIEIPADMLRKVLQGPVDASLEDEASNLSRNFMFELVVAAMVATARFRPTVGGVPDVDFKFEGRRVLIECKRVMSVNKVEERIRQAAKQLQAQVKDTSDWGLVAISITRTINSGGVIWEVASDSEMHPFLDSKLVEVIHRFDPFLQTISHPNVVGVVFYIASPILVPGIGFSPVKRGMFYPMPGTADSVGLKRLTAMLRT